MIMQWCPKIVEEAEKAQVDSLHGRRPGPGDGFAYRQKRSAKRLAMTWIKLGYPPLG